MYQQLLNFDEENYQFVIKVQELENNLYTLGLELQQFRNATSDNSGTTNNVPYPLILYLLYLIQIIYYLNLLSIFYFLPSIFYFLLSTLYPLPSTLYPLPSTLYPLPSALCPLPSALFFSIL
jgi:hypothetical protein